MIVVSNSGPLIDSPVGSHGAAAAWIVAFTAPAITAKERHMIQKDRTPAGRGFERFARSLTRWTGSTPAFMLALSIIIVWGVSGPLFRYSDTWQLVINTGTTVVTFLMVFLIQRTQNKDSLAVHLKLNELIAATQGATNRLVNVEDLSEEELHVLHEHFATLCTLASKSANLGESHSVEEAEVRHRSKLPISLAPAALHPNSRTIE